MRRDHVASTLIRRHFNVVCLLGAHSLLSEMEPNIYISWTRYVKHKCEQQRSQADCLGAMAGLDLHCSQNQTVPFACACSYFNNLQAKYFEMVLSETSSIFLIISGEKLFRVSRYPITQKGKILICFDKKRHCFYLISLLFSWLLMNALCPFITHQAPAVQN